MFLKVKFQTNVTLRVLIYLTIPNTLRQILKETLGFRKGFTLSVFCHNEVNMSNKKTFNNTKQYP